MKKLFLLGLFLGNLLVWGRIGLVEMPSLKVAFLDVGQGDAIFIESPAGRQVLLDGGRNRQVLESLAAVMPFGDEELDLVIATHPDADHIGGLPAVLERYLVLALADIGLPADTAAYRAYEAAVREEVAAGAERLPARRGFKADLGAGVELQIIYPLDWPFGGESNAGSVVVRLATESHTFLLTGDAPLAVERRLAANWPDELKADVLKVGHHGSRTSSDPSFLAAVSPVYAVISAGRRNPYGHPHPEVVKRLEAVGAEVLSTAEQGTIICRAVRSELVCR